MAKSYEYHDAANIFPMMEGADFEKLKEDIAINGVLDPIEIYEGKILDGRNRYLACLQLGKVCPQENYDGSDPIGYVLSKNLARRHLTASQKASAVAKAETLIEKMEEEAKERLAEGQKHGGQTAGKGRPKDTDSSVVTLPPSKGEKTRDKLGKIAGVSGSMIDRARKVRSEGQPELIKAVEDGRMSVTTAAKLTKEPAAVQKEVAEQAKHSGGRYRNQARPSRDEANAPVAGYDKTTAFAMDRAAAAIAQLERIPKGNKGIEEAFCKVEKWIKSQRTKR